MGFNQIIFGAKNIIMGIHLLDERHLERLPVDSIIFNTEQLANETTNWNKIIARCAETFDVLDYSQRNVDKFKLMGCKNARLFKIGHQPELSRLLSAPNQDIDILFYGSLNQRRGAILNELILRGLKVKMLFGAYGKERDLFIERSKLVLNHHFYTEQVFEIVRVFYLLTNSVPVVGEVNDATSIDDMYKGGIYLASYKDLVAGCIEVVKDDSLRKELKRAALDTIAKYPQKYFTQEALGL